MFEPIECAICDFIQRDKCQVKLLQNTWLVVGGDDHDTSRVWSLADALRKPTVEIWHVIFHKLAKPKRMSSGVWRAAVVDFDGFKKSLCYGSNSGLWAFKNIRMSNAWNASQMPIISEEYKLNLMLSTVMANNNQHMRARPTAEISLEDFRECVEKSSNDFKNQLGVDPPESTLAALQLSLDAFSAQGWNIQLQQQCCDTVATTMLVGIEKISTY